MLRIEFTGLRAFTRQPVSSYLAFPPLPPRLPLHYQVSLFARKVDIVMADRDGGISLLHFSCSRLRRALPVILALWSPDFPHRGPFGAPCAAARPGHGLYDSVFSRGCQIGVCRSLFCLRRPALFCACRKGWTKDTPKGSALRNPAHVTGLCTPSSARMRGRGRRLTL